MVHSEARRPHQVKRRILREEALVEVIVLVGIQVQAKGDRRTAKVLFKAVAMEAMARREGLMATQGSLGMLRVHLKAAVVEQVVATSHRVLILASPPTPKEIRTLEAETMGPMEAAERLQAKLKARLKARLKVVIVAAMGQLEAQAQTERLLQHSHLIPSRLLVRH